MKAYFFDSDAIIEDVLVINPEKVKTYIDFNGVANLGYNGAYISMNRKEGRFVAGSNIAQMGPSISFAKVLGTKLYVAQSLFIWSRHNFSNFIVRVFFSTNAIRFEASIL